MRFSQENEECLMLAACCIECIPHESSSLEGRNLPTASRTGGKIWLTRPFDNVWRL